MLVQFIYQTATHQATKQDALTRDTILYANTLKIEYWKLCLSDPKKMMQTQWQKIYPSAYISDIEKQLWTVADDEKRGRVLESMSSLSCQSTVPLKLSKLKIKDWENWKWKREVNTCWKRKTERAYEWEDEGEYNQGEWEV